MIDEDFVNGADRHLGGAGDGADGFAVGMAGEDDASLVGVDDAGPAAGAAAGAGGGEPVAGLADDVAAAILGQGERQVEDEAAVGVLAGGDTVEDLDRNAARKQVVEYEQAFEQVTAESVDLLHGEHVARAQVVDRGGERGPGVDGEAAADLLLEHFHAQPVERVVLPGGLLLARADAHQSYQRHDDCPLVQQTCSATDAEPTGC